MRESHTAHASRNGPTLCISVGDVVLLRNDSTKRAIWKLALVQELLPVRDNKVRAAIVRVPGTQTLLTRSISHLIPVEIRAQPTPTDETHKTKVECNFAEGNETCSAVTPRAPYSSHRR